MERMPMTNEGPVPVQSERGECRLDARIMAIARKVGRGNRAIEAQNAEKAPAAAIGTGDPALRADEDEPVYSLDEYARRLGLSVTATEALVERIRTDSDPH